MNAQTNSSATIQRVELGERSYNIRIGAENLGEVGAALRELVDYERAVVISDQRVAGLYGDTVIESMLRAGYSAEMLTIPEGESHKSFDSLLSIYNFLIDFHYGRDTLLVALGGGVVGDVAGFAAASYVRGVPFAQIPTTLLAMVDSSVGGKTGINHPHAKNMIGAFYQPRMVSADVHTLKTLAPDEFRSGFAEVIKYGAIWSEPFFDYCREHRQAIFELQAENLTHVVSESCAIKAEVVSKDERESGLRMILNFGHTIGHALEAVTNYAHYKHGEAISIGMAGAARIAERMSVCSADVCERIEAFCSDCGLPVRIELKMDVIDIMEKMNKDKKVKNNNIRFVLPTSIGKVEVRDDVEPGLIKEVLSGLMSRE